MNFDPTIRKAVAAAVHAPTRGENMEKTLHAVLALFALGAITMHCNACSPAVVQNVENVAAVAQYERLLEGCRLEGKAAKSYDVYEACANKVDAELCRESGVRCLEGGTQ